MVQLPKSITVSSPAGSHVQGIAVDAKREYLYISITNQLVKADLQGNIIGSVTGLAGHLGCIAYNYGDGKVYGSLEFKKDAIGKGILANLGSDRQLQDGFYMTVFDVDKIDRIGMDAEKDSVMQAVFLKEVYDDYSAPGHRYGCSGIDGTTFAPAFGKHGGKNYLYVAYGVYSDTAREDNDHQVLLQYDVSDWARYAQPLNQENMHRCGPAAPDGKYFVYTGNTTYCIQNLEYDPVTHTMLCAVYKGKKPQYPNFPMYFIDCGKEAAQTKLQGIGHSGAKAFLAPMGICHEPSQIYGCQFLYGSTGIASLGDGTFYVSHPFEKDGAFGTTVKLYRFDPNTAEFTLL